jgi:hypothetical protein
MLTCSHLSFLETLLLNLKNEVANFQIFMRNMRNEKKDNILKELFQLKKDFVINADRIKLIEGELDLLVDIEIRTELEMNRSFDILHAEKMTPKFLTLCKSKTNVASLDTLRDPAGQPFISTADRDQHIIGFFDRIYNADQGNMPLDDNCVENFLGAEICNDPVVLNSKLTPEESNFFDRDLTLHELDVAIDKLNTKSAGGLDGIPTIF